MTTQPHVALRARDGTNDSFAFLRFHQDQFLLLAGDAVTTVKFGRLTPRVSQKQERRKTLFVTVIFH